MYTFFLFPFSSSILPKNDTQKYYIVREEKKRA